MEKCFRCNRTDEEVRLFDGFYGMENVKACERCSLIENMPIIKSPNSDNFNKNSHQTVRQRLSKMAGLDFGIKKEKSIYETLKDLDSQPELEKPENINFKMVDNFHWVVLRERRRKCLSQKQLAEAIHENDEVVKMIEKNVLPKGALQIINKLERFFGIVLIKKKFSEKIDEEVMKFSNQELPEPFKPVEILPEPEPFKPEPFKSEMEIMRKQEAEDMLKIAIKEETNPVLVKKEQVSGTPLKLVDFKRHSKEEVTLADLRRLQDKVEMDTPKKDKIQIGREQTEDIGKENIEDIKKIVYRNPSSSPKKPISGKTPTIYDLMKQKQERDKDFTGREIDLTKEEKEKIGS